MKLKEIVEFFYDVELRKTIITAGARTYLITDNDKEIYHSLQSIESLCKNSEIGKFLINKNLVYPSIKDKQGKELINSRTLLYILDRAYSNQELSYSDIIDKFNQPILVIGCGGVGTIVLNNLVQSGFQNFTIIDGDTVELTNLNRQLFYNLDDLSMDKVEVLGNKLAKLNPKIRIKAYKKFIQCADDLLNILKKENYKLVVNCADAPSNIEDIVMTACSRLNIPVVSGYVGLETGTINPIFDRNHVFIKSNNFENNMRPLKASISMTNMITSAFLSQVIFDYLFSDILPTEYDFYSNHTINFQRFGVQVDEK